MWRVALAAAVAGGLLAKHLFTASPKPSPARGRAKEGDYHADHFTAEQILSSPPSPLTPLAPPNQPAPTSEYTGGEPDLSIFRFSSSDSGGNSRSAVRVRSKKARVSVKASNVGGLCNGDGEQGNRFDRRMRAFSVRRVSLLFRKRKTGKNCPGKRDFSCTTDSPSFEWGLSIGIYMMAVGKEEISKLSSVVDETAKVVHELKTELYRRRSHDGQSPTSSNLSRTKAFSSPGKSASSILTEELHKESTEMEWLQAELESELLKLPTFVNDASHCNQAGVCPAELTEKLSDLLIKQQEDHISELESELLWVYSKLQQKETELDKLKDCVKRLTTFSLSR